MAASFGASFDVETEKDNLQLIKPNNNNNVENVYSIRYKFIRWFTVPLGCIPYRTPVIGGKTLIELFFMVVLLVLGLNYCIWFAPADSAGGATANVAAVTIALGFKTNILTILFGISYERALYYHKYGALLWVAFAISHGIRETPQPTTLFSGKNLLGFIMLMLIGTSVSLYFSKRLIPTFKFEWFYFGHVLLFIGIVVVAFLHGATQVAYAAGAWIIDLGIRYILTLKRIKVKASLLPCGVVRLKFTKVFDYSPGQYCFINVPAISGYQFHPFSISSAPHEDEVAFHVRSLGDWTNQLYKHIASLCMDQKVHPRDGVYIDICVEGPFGCLTIDIKDATYKTFLLVAGGIGITPTQSVLNSLVFQHATGDHVLNKCLMIWSVKDKAMVDTIDVASNLDSESAVITDLPLSFQPDLFQLTGIEDRLTEIRVQHRGVSLGSNEAKDASAKVRLDRTSSSHAKVATTKGKGLNSKTVFQGEFYLTSIRSEQDFSKANIDLSRQPYLTFGRPSLPEIVDKVASYCSENISDRGNRVAVIACGPSNMISELVDICAVSRKGIKFDLHQEQFDF